MNMAAALSMQLFCTGLELLTAAKPGIIIQDDGEPFVQHTLVLPFCCSARIVNLCRRPGCALEPFRLGTCLLTVAQPLQLQGCL